MSQMVVNDISLELVKEVLKILGETGYESIMHQNIFRRIFESVYNDTERVSGLKNWEIEPDRFNKLESVISFT